MLCGIPSKAKDRYVDTLGIKITVYICEKPRKRNRNKIELRKGISAVITSFCSIKLDVFDEVVVIHIPIFSIYKITVVVKIELIHSEYYRDVFGLPLFFI